MLEELARKDDKSLLGMAVGTSIGCVALDAYRLAEPHVQNVITHHGWDLSCGAMLTSTLLLSKLASSPVGKAMCVAIPAVGCSLYELSSMSDLVGGVYDPKDMLAYTAGSLAALGVHLSREE